MMGIAGSWSAVTVGLVLVMFALVFTEARNMVGAHPALDALQFDADKSITHRVRSYGFEAAVQILRASAINVASITDLDGEHA
ncbi:MAG: hypothetical protein ABIY56_09545 [Dokdonella sp.]